MTLLVLSIGLLAWGIASVTVVEDWLFAQAYLHQATWQSLIAWLGGQLQVDADGGITDATLPNSSSVVGVMVLLGTLIWASGSVLASRLSGLSWGDVARTWGWRGGRWLWLLLVWSQGRVIAFLLGADWLHLLLGTTNEFVWATIFGLVVAEWWRVASHRSVLSGPLEGQELMQQQRAARRMIWLAFAVYSLVYTAMNWGLWFNMRIPHGDSAMYEEHLWNIWHGKGFRSYLDQGLFLGEHIQVIHLAILPLHLLWPSHLLLELCQSLALAATIFPVYSIALRHTSRPQLAAVVGVVALLAFPLHYLDISIDVKTFRPTALAIPVVVAAINAYEAGRFRQLLVWALVGLSAQEDFALVFGPLGLWMAWDGWRSQSVERRNWGLGLLFGSALYLLLVMKVLLPYFRDGVNIHYASYFAKFGQTPSEIVITMLTRPLLVLQSLLNINSLSWLMCLLFSLGGLPLLSPSRLLTALPLFILLCLNELAQQPPGPFHHFHAPILPLLFWAMAAGIGRLCPNTEAVPQATLARHWWRVDAATFAAFAVTCAVWTGACFSHHPLSFRFWDSGRAEYWRDRYIPGERPAQWANVESLIPESANVASTDFVHPRLTHHRRSYDYSQYQRTVAGGTTEVPADTDFIVIDTRHPYSWIHGPEDVRELQKEPRQWELLPDSTDGYFLILKKSSQNSPEE